MRPNRFSNRRGGSEQGCLAILAFIVLLSWLATHSLAALAAWGLLALAALALLAGLIWMGVLWRDARRRRRDAAAPKPAPKPAPPIRRFDLDPSQLAAVRSRAPRTLVEGGPGTGKTEVVARWAVGLIAEGVDPSKVLILTPNLRAAKAMRQRTAQLLSELPEPKAPPTVGTFLSVAEALFREDPAAFGLQENFTIQSEYDSVCLWQEVLHEARFPARDLRWEAQRFRSIVANSVRSCDHIEASLSKHFKDRTTWQAADAVCRTYEKRKRALNLLDPEDVLKTWSARMLGNLNTLRRLREKFPCVAVDDFQNCCLLEARALGVWNPARLLVLGDDDQAIGLLHGAEPGRVSTFKTLEDEDPEAHTLTLAFNHRSGRHLLDFANDVHRLTRGPAAPRLRAAPEPPPLASEPRRTSFNKWEDPTAEAAEALAWFRKLRARGEAAEDLCVLARSPFDLEPLKTLLNQSGVRYEDLDLTHELRDTDPAPDDLPAPPRRGLTLATIHSAAGREWNHVLLLGMGELQLPAPKGNPEEERRLFYVAVTRAKLSLTCSYPRQLPRKPPQGPCKFLPLDQIEKWNR